jgi:tetratricopeptide (TPR) repeat protein
MRIREPEADGPAQATIIQVGRVQEKAQVMPDLPERSHRLRWITGLLTIVLCAFGALRWWQGKRDEGSGALARGDWAYSRKDWEGSARRARERLKAAPDDPRALRLAARSLARQNRDQAAISTYALLELVLMTAEDYFLLGRALSRTGQDDLALKALEASRDADPDRPEMLDELAQVYFRKKRPAAAEAIAKRLVREPGWEARANLMLGPFSAALNDPAGAASALQRAFELDPDGKNAAPNPVRPLRTLLVRSLLRTNQPAAARRFLETIPESRTDSELTWLLSRSFIQEKAWRQATKALQQGASYRHDHPVEPEPAPYVGAARCAGCHRAMYETHLSSRHSTTFGYARDANRFPLPNGVFPDPGNPKVSHRFTRDQSGVRIETQVGDRIFRAVGEYAFGSPDHYVTLVGRDDNGRSRMFRISSYDSPKGKGWDISTGLDPHPANPDEYLGASPLPLDGARRCLICHTTNFRAIENQAGPESADHSIGCEVCHGPGGNHVLTAEAEFPDLAIISPGRDSGLAINEVCAQCHGMTEPERFSGEPNDPGWFRFESARMEQSRCYTASPGTLSCVTCHDPHKNAETSAAPYEAKCVSCHGPGKTICPVNATKGCIECHMPRAWREQTHSYKIDHHIRIQDRLSAGN